MGTLVPMGHNIIGCIFDKITLLTQNEALLIKLNVVTMI
jgi:hypothetical protein